MKTAHVVYADGDHRWIALSRDPARPDYLIDTNEYVIEHRGEALLTDPGGIEIFPAVFSSLSEAIDPDRVKALFASHQDPDIISSLAMWLEFNPALRCYLSRLWCTFVPHFGGTGETFIPIPDEGMDVDVGGLRLAALPAHYLHSSGNFQLHDPKAKILFSGDVGAAMIPPDAPLYVEDFDAHIRAAEGFHRRWMGSVEAKRDWCERIAKLDLDFMCPQHGAIYRGADIQRFVNWFDELPVGLSTFRGARVADAA